MEIDLDKMKEQDLVKILFAENPGIVIQVSNKHKEEVKKILEDAGVGYIKIGKPTDERHILVSKDGATYQSAWTTCVMSGIFIVSAGPQTVHERMRQETFRELQDAAAGFGIPA